ncbi:hypothetical protein [Nostoc sp. 106C]|uniref:hypothetical protein n=1 Tax=Nostoc sp. 106C TaxID=1932667 RepID=UPI000A387CCA|nr:hypothetical protein [Nostoc sp. 106C]OUL18723.1 hypothetical protein BV375_33580 [Nostoc sp. 106C]OUL25095.1 hypothetical protein BV378_16135 [Nostoc sp. RF31YmG]
MRTYLSSGHGIADAPTSVLYFRLSFGGIFEIGSPCNLNFAPFTLNDEPFILEVAAFTLKVAPLSQNDKKYLTIAEYTG